MSEAKQETISDIVAEMRDEGHTGDASCLEWVETKMRHYADRIEAAYNRLAIPTPKQWTEIAQKLCENVLLERENAHLKQRLALKDETNETQEPSLDAATVISIARHYCHAKDKHPYFADKLCIDEDCVEDASEFLRRMRNVLPTEKRDGLVYAETLAVCELAEIAEALARGDKESAVKECYDTIAVMLRIIDVIEGRQKLGRPKAAHESEAKA